MPAPPPTQQGRAGDGLSRCAILILKEGKLKAHGTQSTEFLGEEAAQLLDQPLDSLPPPVRHLLLEAVTRGCEQNSTCLELTQSDGRRREFHALSVPLPNSDGPAGAQAVLALFEVSQFREFDLSLRRLERLAGIGTLAATLAHEMRNSMVAAKTFIDLLLEKEPQTEVAEVVQRELRRMESLLNQLLRFAGPGKQTFGPVRVHSVLEHSLRLLAPQLDNHSIRLERDFQAPADVVSGDEYALEQAFINLLFNAIDAMGAHGTLTVRTEGFGEVSRLRLTFQDTGVGIAPENLERMFEPFFTTKNGGTGLGLAITRRIVEEHGGTIRVSSQPGQGAEFELTLPLIPPAAR